MLLHMHQLKYYENKLIPFYHYYILLEYLLITATNKIEVRDDITNHYYLEQLCEIFLVVIEFTRLQVQWVPLKF